MHSMSMAESHRAAEVQQTSALEVLTGRQPTRYERFAKPVLDRVFAAILLVLLGPVMLATAVIVRWRLGPPVLLRQRRVGLDGKHFSMLKFRTMQPCRRRGETPYVGPERRVTHKTPHDPRLDPVGRVLRAASLDELPQLFNILRGEMSVVGPRPELAEIVESKYEAWQHGRHAVKPGLTGLWQVTERANSDMLMHERTDVDLIYTQQVTARTDLAILLKTVPVFVGKQRGF